MGLQLHDIDTNGWVYTWMGSHPCLGSHLRMGLHHGFTIVPGCTPTHGFTPMRVFTPQWVHIYALLLLPTTTFHNCLRYIQLLPSTTATLNYNLQQIRPTTIPIYNCKLLSPQQPSTAAPGTSPYFNSINVNLTLDIWKGQGFTSI